MLGCGYEGHAGKAKRPCPDDEHDIIDTCPHYLARTTAVRGADALLDDYRRGSLGNVMDLPSPLYSALRTLHVEWERVKLYVMDESDRLRGER